MISWQLDSTETTEWGNCKQPNEIDYWPLLHPFTPGHRTILSQFQNTTLLENITPKRLYPANIILFDPLPPNVIAAIENWLIGLEYHNNFKHFLSRFKYKGNTVLNTILCK